jgi:hypothetical protein
MKPIALLFLVGVSCFLTGVLVCYLWFPRQLPPAMESATDSPASEDRPVGGRATAAGNNNVRATKFAALDTDQDGKLSLAEFGAGRAPGEAAKWFGRRDADHDGFISKQEFLPVSASSDTQ